MPRQCRVFDDRLSLLHFIVPLVLTALGLDVILRILWAVYVVYEVVEGRYRRDCPGADIIEFLVGVGAGHILKICTGGLGSLVARLVWGWR